MKKISLILVIFVSFFILTGCTENKEQEETNLEFKGYTYIPIYNGKTIQMIIIPRYETKLINEVEKIEE